MTYMGRLFCTLMAVTLICSACERGHPYVFSVVKVERYICSEITRQAKQWDAAEAKSRDLFLPAPECASVVLVRSQNQAASETNTGRYFGRVTYNSNELLASKQHPQKWIVVYVKASPGDKTKATLVWNVSNQPPPEMR